MAYLCLRRTCEHPAGAVKFFKRRFSARASKKALELRKIIGHGQEFASVTLFYCEAVDFDGRVEEWLGAVKMVSSVKRLRNEVASTVRDLRRLRGEGALLRAQCAQLRVEVDGAYLKLIRARAVIEGGLTVLSLLRSDQGSNSRKP